MNWTKYRGIEKFITLAKNTFAITFGFIVALILVEIIFQVLPVSDSTQTQDVNSSNPYMRFAPSRDVNISIGKFFEIQVNKKTNKQGFFDDQDFALTSSKNKVVVIGDSYVEALQVTNSQAIHGQLQTLLGKEWHVNGVGASGSPLSQYVAYAKYLRETIDPNIYIYL